MAANPDQPPEGRLIQTAADRQNLSARQAATMAGMSDARWRNIINGYQSIGRGERIPAKAPPLTLARMALVVGVNPTQLREVGRHDAAAELERLIGNEERSGPPPLPGALARAVQNYADLHPDKRERFEAHLDIVNDWAEQQIAADRVARRHRRTA